MTQFFVLFSWILNPPFRKDFENFSIFRTKPTARWSSTNIAVIFSYGIVSLVSQVLFVCLFICFFFNQPNNFFKADIRDCFWFMTVRALEF